jgi:hypothetical protein
MMPLLRYWLLPGRLRRLPRVAQIAVAVIFILMTASLAVAIARTKESIFSFGPLLIPAMILLYGLPGILSGLGVFAGATLIASERQKQTWEALLLSPMPVRQVVGLKMLARLAFCLLLALPPTVWLITLVHVTVRENGFSNDGVLPPRNVAVIRIAIFLIWTFLHVIGHLLPFLALGAAVSARSRKVIDALLFCSIILTGYAVIFWQLIVTAHVRNIMEPSNSGLGLALFRWPVLPYLSGDFPSRRMILPSGWQNNLMADLIWMAAIPTVFTLLAITWSRLSRRSPAPRKLPTHG